MPRLTSRTLLAVDGLSIRHVTCDGVDGPRPADEHVDGGARVILVRSGRFEFQDGAGRGMASPTTGLFLPDGHRHRIRHVDGGDTCLAVQGDVCRSVVEAGPILRRIPVDGFLAVAHLSADLRRGETPTRLAVEERLVSALSTPRAEGARGRDRIVADAIAYELEHHVNERCGLADLSRRVGVSVFHACRVFKRQTGFSIHRYQQEIRLRHALAWLVESDRSIAWIALECGFANQGHLTNVFVRRFRTTPGRVRARASRRELRRLLEPNRPGASYHA